MPSPPIQLNKTPGGANSAAKVDHVVHVASPWASDNFHRPVGIHCFCPDLHVVPHARPIPTLLPDAGLESGLFGLATPVHLSTIQSCRCVQSPH